MKKNFKKIAIASASSFSGFFIIILCLMMLLSYAGLDKSSTDDTVTDDNGSAMETFIKVALDECVRVNGLTGGDKYRKWYTGRADGQAWCATFVSWCANEAGILDTAIPKFQGCDQGVEWFKKRNQFDYTSSWGGKATPSRGKLIFFNEGKKNDSTHVGIVTKTDANKVYTVEGNTSNTIKERSYKLSNKRILGYATVIYPSSSTSAEHRGSLSEGFKFFAQFESGQNYGQGFSKGDGYHAMGYYQFDNRYSLQDFLGYCYSSDTSKYNMFAPYLHCSKASLANNKGLDKAWKQAYQNDPNDFASKQDEYEYNHYYLPAERALKQKGIDVSGKADAVKGMVCSISNWAGNVQATKVIVDSGAKTSMNDRQFVNKVYDYLISLKSTDLKKYGKYSPKYYASWHKRWIKEKDVCLKYL